MKSINIYRQIRKIVSGIMIFMLLCADMGYSAAEGLAGILPPPGERVALSSFYQPPLLVGLKVSADNPLRFNFIIDAGSRKENLHDLRKSSRRMIGYFLAGLTIPDDDLWVNLSPQEKDRISPDALAATWMGRDMLAQDYLLKQIASALSYPESSLGRTFWADIYRRLQKDYGTTDIPVEVLNKVWVMPQTAVLHERKDMVLVSESRLKVMMAADYLAAQTVPAGYSSSQSLVFPDPPRSSRAAADDAMRVWLLPVIEEQVNQGEHFSVLRQIYHALILARWFKSRLRDEIWTKTYIGQNKTGGIEVDDKSIREKIYRRYLEAFRKGAYSYIREEGSAEGELIARKYFSGGVDFGRVLGERSIVQTREPVEKFSGLVSAGRLFEAAAGVDYAQEGAASKRMITVYPGAVYEQGNISAAEEPRTIYSQNFSRMFPGFSGVARTQLNSAGGLFFKDKVYWHTRSGYQKQPVILVIREGELQSVYDEKNQQLFPFGENFVYPGQSYEEGGAPVNPEGCLNLNDFIPSRYPLFTGVVDRFRLHKRGGLRAFLGNSLWGARSGFENALVRLVVRENKIVEVFSEDGERLYPFDENYIYSAEVEDNGDYRPGDLLTPGGFLITDTRNNWFRQHPRFTGVVRKVRLDALGGLTGFNTGFLGDWRLSFAGLNPQEYLLWLKENGYIDKDQRVLSLLSAGHLESLEKGEALNRVLSESRRGIYWYSLREYSSALVDVVMKNGEVIRVNNGEGGRIYPFDEGFVYAGAQYQDGEIIAGRLVNPRGSRDKDDLNRVLKNFSGFSGVISRVRKSLHGKLQGIEDGFSWYQVADKADGLLDIEVKDGRVAAVYSSNDKTRLYPNDHYYIYEGAYLDESARRRDGRLVSPGGMRFRKTFNRFLSDHPGFSGVVESFPLAEDGSLGMIGQVRHTRSIGRKGETVRLQLAEGKLAAVFNEEGQNLYQVSGERSVGEPVHDVFEVEESAGEWIRGRSLTEKGFSSRRQLNEWLKSRSRGTFMLRTVLNFRGGLEYISNGQLEEWRFYERGLDLGALLPRLIELGCVSKDGQKVLSGLPDNDESFGSVSALVRDALKDSINGFYWENMTGQEGAEIYLVLAEGKLLAAYDRGGQKLYPYTGGFFYSGAVYQDGEIQGGVLLNPRGVSGSRSARNILRYLPANWSGIISRIPADENGRLGSWAGTMFWSGPRKDTENALVDIEIKNGKASGVYETGTGRRLFPFSRYYVYEGAVIKDGKREGGILRSPFGLYSRQALYSFLLRQPGFSGVIEHVPLSAQGVLQGFPGQEAGLVFDDYGTEEVTVLMQKGLVKEVFSAAGKKLQGREPLAAKDSLSRVDSFRDMIDSGDARTLVMLFGVRGALRIMYSLSVSVTPARIVDIMPRFFEAIGGAGSRPRGGLPARELLSAVKSVKAFNFNEDMELEQILTRELFQVVYARVVEDHTFLESLEYSAASDEIPPLLLRVVENILARFHDVAGLSLKGIKPSSEPMFYQRVGIRFILDKKRVILADKPGLGKTLQVLGAAVNAFEGRGAAKVLVIAPKTSVDSVWRRQIRHHLTGEQPVYVVQSKNDAGFENRRKNMREARFIIVNYEAIQGEDARPLRDFLKAMETPVDFIIVDEAHRMRNDNLAVKALAELDAPYKVLLSASAQYGRKIGKIFNLLHWLKPEVYTSRVDFSERRFKSIKIGLRDMLLRRHLEEVLMQIPSLAVEYRTVRLEGEQSRIYAQMEDYIRRQAGREGFFSIFASLRLLIRAAVDTALVPRLVLRSPESGETFEGIPGLFPVQTPLSFPCLQGGCRVSVDGTVFDVSLEERESHSAKYQALDEIVADVVTGKKENLVVFSGVIKVVEDLARRYRERGFDVLLINGHLTRLQRTAVLQEFQSAERPVILIATYQTMGESVDLTNAHYGVLVDSPWLGREQIYGRLRRIGQQSDVRFFVLQALGTVDQHIERVSAAADMVQDIVLDDGKALAESEDVLARVLSLSGRKWVEGIQRISSLADQSNFAKQEGAAADFGFLKKEEGSFSASFDGKQLKGIFSGPDESKRSFEGAHELIAQIPFLGAGERKFVGRFIMECIQKEDEQSVKVRQTILWHILSALVPGFGQIDYHGRIEAMVLFGGRILRALMENPDLKKEDIVFPRDIYMEELYNETMGWLDGSNLLRFFSWTGLIPFSYYYEGRLVKYDSPVSFFSIDGKFEYHDSWIVDRIAPVWRVAVSATDAESSGMMSDIRRFRVLEEIEEKRLANQLRMGNRAAEEVLAGAHLRDVVEMARNAAFSVPRRLGRRTYGTVHVDQLYAEGTEWLVYFIRSYADNQMYERIGLKNYLWARLAPKIYSRAFAIASESLKLQDDAPVFSADRDSPGVIDMISGGDDPQGLVEAEDMFGQFLREQGFNQTDRHLIRLFVLDGCSQEDILREVLAEGTDTETSIDADYIGTVISGFLEKMQQLGPQKVRALLNQDGSASDDSQTPAGGVDLRGRSMDAVMHKDSDISEIRDVFSGIADQESFSGFVPVVFGLRQIGSLGSLLSR